MATLVENIVNGYNYLFYELANPVTRDWQLVGHPLKLISILTVYFIICTRLGPWYMKDRKPYDLTKVLKAYNIIQILVSIYIVQEGVRYIFFYDYNYCCQGLETDPAIVKWVASGVWIYYAAKISELLDTVFFVLRKSDRQITSLHLHHHTLMPISTWIAVTYYPGGQGILVGILNSFVHIIMYTYYLLSGMGDKFKKNLWWKKHVTILQLVQFVMIGAHSINSLFYTCSYPSIFKILTSIYGFVFLKMFGQFYYHTYIKKGKQTQNGKVPHGIKNCTNGLKNE